MTNLTGVWFGDDGALYYVSQNGGDVWWAGQSHDGHFENGLTFTSVFRGQYNDGTLRGNWSDVPRGTRTNGGTIAIDVAMNTNGDPVGMQMSQQTGGFSASRWYPITFDRHPPATIESLFHHARRNGGDSLGEKLKLYKEPVVVFGTVIPGDRKVSLSINYKPTAGRSYQDFICSGNGKIRSVPDGDVSFDIQVDREQLDSQHRFWTDGWIRGRSPRKIRRKLDRYHNHLHCETVIYARDTRCRDIKKHPSKPVLPGWQEQDGTSVLLNGRPINGTAEIGNHIKGDSYQLLSWLGSSLPVGARVRVTGPLVADTEASGDSDNTEIHPVYSFDIIVGTPQGDISGTWADDDGGTYYIQQSGNVVWWFAASPSRNRLFAGVFHGSNENGHVVGDYHDVPLGFRAFTDRIDLELDDSKLFLRATAGDSSIVGRGLHKLYDAPSQTGPIG